jgi:hypothetical protein
MEIHMNTDRQTDRRKTFVVLNPSLSLHPTLQPTVNTLKECRLAGFTRQHNWQKVWRRRDVEKEVWLVNVRSRRSEQRETEGGCGRRWSIIGLFVCLLNSELKICEIFTAN